MGWSSALQKWRNLMKGLKGEGIKWWVPIVGVLGFIMWWGKFVSPEQRPNLTPAQVELLDALLATETPEERTRLFREHRALVTPDFVDVVVDIAFQRRGDEVVGFLLSDIALEAAKFLPDEDEQAWVLLNRGRMHFYRGENREALHYYDRALALYEKLQDRLGRANCYRSEADVHFHEGNWTTALALYEQALSLYRAEQAKSGEAGCLQALGDVALRLGDHEGALERYEQALLLYHETGSGQGEANCYQGRGDLALRLGDHTAALADYIRARSRYEQVGDLLGAANCWQKEGDIARLVADYETARAAYNEALRLFHEVGNRQGEANCYLGQGQIALQEGDALAAWEACQRALELYRKAKEKLGEANALHCLGDVALQWGEMEEARTYYTEAMALYWQVGYPLGVANGHKSRGDLALGMGNYEAALEAYQQARALYWRLNVPFSLAWVHYRLGCVYEARGQLMEAQRELEEAVRIVESLRQRAATEQARTGTVEQFRDVYAAWVRVLLALDRRPEAFHAAERAHGRTLLDILTAGRADLSKGLSPEERAREQKLDRKVAALNARLAQEVGRAEPDEVLVKRLRLDLAEARQALEEYQRSLYARHPDLAARRGAQPIKGPDLATFLPPDTGLLEYLMGPQRTYLFAVTAEGAQVNLQVYTIEQPRLMLTKEVAALRRTYARRRPNYAAAQRLYEWLLKPALTAWADREPRLRRLVIVPDGALFELPFQALVRSDREGEPFLWEDFELVYAVSASILKACREEARAARRRPRGMLLIFANPDFGPRSWQPALTRAGALAPLPGTAAEAAAIAAEYGETAVVYQGAAAQESTAKRELPHYRYLHFATHGFLDAINPLYSAIALAAPPPDSEEDGFLEARELAQLDLAAELVVLSACETARGRLRQGEGLLGLTWAVFAAGAPSAVVSQWAVSDRSTQELMAAFYRYLKAGRGKAAALRQAALELLEEYEQPFYWAPFILVGEWE